MVATAALEGGEGERGAAAWLLPLLPWKEEREWEGRSTGEVPWLMRRREIAGGRLRSNECTAVSVRVWREEGGDEVKVELRDSS